MPLCWRPNFHESHSSDSWYYADYNGLEAHHRRQHGPQPIPELQRLAAILNAQAVAEVFSPPSPPAAAEPPALETVEPELVEPEAPPPAPELEPETAVA
jgi:hypothetical protein